MAEPNVDLVRVWLFRSLAALVIGGIASATSYFVSCGVKEAELRSTERSKKLDIEHRQRQLQLDLLKEVIGVSKQADFRNPTSLYRLGLIAIAVNENEDVFGIRMIRAAMTLNRMFMQLSPISGLKRQLADSDKLLSDIDAKIKEATKAEHEHRDKLAALRQALAVPNLLKYQKRNLRHQQRAEEAALAEAALTKKFYSAQQDRERRMQDFFNDQLDEQERSLKQAIRNAQTGHDIMQSKQRDILAALKTIGQQYPALAQTTQVLIDDVKKLSTSSLQVDYSIVRLRAEAAVQAKELTVWRNAYTELLNKCGKPSDVKAPPRVAPRPRPVPRPAAMAPAMEPPRPEPPMDRGDAPAPRIHFRKRYHRPGIGARPAARGL